MKFTGRFFGFLMACTVFSGALATPAQAISLPFTASEPAQQDNSPPAHPVDYAALAAVLNDPKARDALVNALNKLAQQSKTGGAKKEQPAKPVDHSLASRMAVDTSRFFQDIGHSAQGMYQRITSLMQGPRAEIDLNQFWACLWPLASLIILSYGLWLIAERLFHPLLGRLNRWATAGSHRQHLLRAALSLTFAGAVGLGVLALIYLLGNAVSVSLAGGVEVFAEHQALFLNAFVMLELTRLILRLILVPSFEGLRLFPISAVSARFWTRRISWLLLGVGYGMMVVVPIVHRSMGEDIAQILTGVLAITAFLLTISTLLRQRIAIRTALMHASERQINGLASWLLTLLARTWHVLAVGYVGMVFLVGLTRPHDALPFIGSATGYSLLTLAAGFLASGLLTQLIGGEVRLKEHHRMRLPRLEQRLNSYLPWIVRLFRLLIVISVVSAVLAIWHVVNLYRWLATPVGQQFLSSAFDILFVTGFALLAWLVIASLIEVKLNAERDHMPSARIQTLLALFRNVVAIALVTMTVMMVLSEMGVNIGPLLAGAGVLGLAIGFGAQKLVQDVITGIFIQLENAINTGDTVTAGGITGTVENLTIRSAGIRDLSGTYHIVPFSSVGVVSNFMRGYAYHKAEYGIAYRENSDDAIVHLRAAFDELMTDPLMKGKILEPIQIPGVTELAASSVNIRVMIKTTPGDQWSVGRAYNRLVKLHFDAAGIEIPFPHTTIYFGEDKTGQPTSANVRLVQRRPPADPEHEAAPVETVSATPSKKVSQASARDEATRWMPDESDIDGDYGH